MKKTGLLVGLLVGALLLGACLEPKTAPIRNVPRCESQANVWQDQTISTIAGVYKPLNPGGCLAYLAPFDQSAWFESRLNSRRVRGESNLRIGCVHCPATNLDCNSTSNCTGCSAAILNFDFTRLQEDARISTAKIAVRALENKQQLARALVQGRLNVGGDYAVVSQSATVLGDWILFDITPFACRAVLERRNSVSFDISLPCGADPASSMATVAYDWRDGPTLIVEYR